MVWDDWMEVQWLPYSFEILRVISQVGKKDQPTPATSSIGDYVMAFREQTFSKGRAYDTLSDGGSSYYSQVW